MKLFQCAFLSLALAGTASFGQAKYLGWSIGYFTTWDNTYTPETIPWEAFTHMAYFQVWPNADGSLRLPNESIAKRVIAEAHKRGKKAIFCVGGAGVKTAFIGATNAQNMNKFNSNILAYLRKLGWDGFDTDWEEDFNDAQFIAWHKALRDSINKMVPVPLMTIAAEDWFPITAKVHMYVDQVNNMRYTGTSASQYASKLKVFTDAGAAKGKVGAGLGISMGMTVQQTTDMCNMVINEGFGGLIQWDVTRDGGAPANMAAIAKFVNPVSTGIYTGQPTRYRQQVTLAVENGRLIRYSMPSGSNGSTVDLGLYDLKGALVKTLFRGQAKAGETAVAFDRPEAGAYILRLSEAGSILGSGSFIAR